MDALRAATLSEFEDYEWFHDTPDGPLKLVEVKVQRPLHEAIYQTQDITEDELQDRLLQPTDEKPVDSDASLTLVCMPSCAYGTGTEGASMTKRGFLQLLDAFQIDQNVLHAVKFNLYGVHELITGDRVRTFFAADMRYQLFWSFIPERVETKAILIVRRSFWYNSIFEEFTKILRQERNHIYSPYIVFFVALIDMTQWCDEARYEVWKKIIKFEHTTGYGPYGRSEADAETAIPMERLAGTAKTIQTTSVQIAGFQRHMDILDGLIEALENSYETREWCRAKGSERHNQLCERDIRRFNTILPTMTRNNRYTRSGITYMLERIRSQSSVIFPLMTQEDARISRQIAEASRDLAALSKRDSSSMKTIAVMTMVFLPATFFAALFAIPSLQWDEPNVIQDRFWVYWAFTLPSTAFVFLIWIVLNYDDQFTNSVDRIRSRNRQTIHREKDSLRDSE